MGIPEVSREHPVVQEFTHLAAALDTLVDQTLAAATAEQRPTKLTSLARERELLNAPDMIRSLHDRYAVVNALLVAASTFLSDGMGTETLDTAPYAFRKLQDAARRLGYDLTLTKKPPVSLDPEAETV